jgi:methionyl-tRNA formyltransferase
MLNQPAKAVFLGTPEFAVSSLEALVERPEFDVTGVVTQPDRPAGRGQQMLASAVKLSAQAHGIPVFQPDSLRDSTAIERIRQWSPDVLVVAAYGQILRQPVLELPSQGCVNVHASLLPRWRGAAPIQYAIKAGDSETGITIMKMDAGLDTGPILFQQTIPILPNETASSLHDKLASLAAEILPDALLAFVEGRLAPRPQSAEGVMLARTLKKADGQIDWSQPAIMIDRHVRAYTPWPGTFTYVHGELLRIVQGEPRDDLRRGQPAGAVMMDGAFLAVQTGKGLYLLHEVQLAGKRKMRGATFAHGHPDVVGAILSSAH